MAEIIFLFSEEKSSLISKFLKIILKMLLAKSACIFMNEATCLQNLQFTVTVFFTGITVVKHIFVFSTQPYYKML